MCEWINIANTTPTFLASSSTTDMIFETKCPSNIPVGYYNARLRLVIEKFHGMLLTFFEKRFRLFIKDVPIASLEADEKFVISTNGKPLEEITDTLSVRTNAFQIFSIS